MCACLCWCVLLCCFALMCWCGGVRMFVKAYDVVGVYSCVYVSPGGGVCLHGIVCFGESSCVLVCDGVLACAFL